MSPTKTKSFKRYEELVDLIDASKPDAYRFYFNKSEDASIRLRKKLIQIRELCSELRKSIIRRRKENFKPKRKHEKTIRPRASGGGNVPAPGTNSSGK